MSLNYALTVLRICVSFHFAVLNEDYSCTSIYVHEYLYLIFLRAINLIFNNHGYYGSGGLVI